MENKYNNSKIYKISPLNGLVSDIYIGSTTQELDLRWKQHTRDYKRWLNGKTNQTASFNLFNKYNVNNCCMTLIEHVNVNTKQELHAREAFYITSMECINKIIPGRTPQEYRNENKEIIKSKIKQYYNDNIEKTKQYYEDNKEKIKQYRIDNKEKRKEYQQQYYKDNNDSIKEQKKAYNQLNREQRNTKERERYHQKKFDKAEAEQETQLNNVMGGCINL
jgi:hypothetical protein